MTINMVMAKEPLYPIVILINKLKNDDIQLQLNSIRRLYTIALNEEWMHKKFIPCCILFC
jgi:hypothetical protein